MDYKEKLEKAKRLYETANADQRYVLESLFPELKKSEDEKIRKVLIDYFKRYKEQEECGIKTFYGIPTDNILAWLEKQGEQKLADKVKPKFHEGDWIIRNAEGFKHNTYLVTEIKDYYVCEELKGRRVTFTFNDVHKNFKLWDISDAKDGDVLASKDKEDILIYKSHSVIDLLLTSHVSFNKKEGFCPRQYSAWDSNEFIPATKEQRDLLFTKMKEAGYEWDTENKQLKKISQRMISAEAKEAMYDRPAWSEEDEKELNSCIEAIEACYKWDTMVNWLKSLKERYTWKPSDEQIHAFEQVYDWYNDNFAPSETLTSLYNDLKKLKGE